jgi:hypothetical protein
MTAGSPTEIQTFPSWIQIYSITVMSYQNYALWARNLSSVNGSKGFMYVTQGDCFVLTGRIPSDGLYLSNSSTTLECPLCEALNSAVAPSYKAHAG